MEVSDIQSDSHFKKLQRDNQKYEEQIAKIKRQLEIIALNDEQIHKQLMKANSGLQKENRELSTKLNTLDGLIRGLFTSLAVLELDGHVTITQKGKHTIKEKIAEIMTASQSVKDKEDVEVHAEEPSTSA
jgi:predicted  nucleic acid-binding Zn-ribbon protein